MTSQIHVRKYYYGDTCQIINFEDQNDMGIKIISDSLARVIDINAKTKCVAINMCFSNNDKGKKLYLQEINVCPKKLEFFNEKELKGIVENILKYCFSQKQTMFLHNEKEEKLLRQVKEILLEVTKNTMDQTLIKECVSYKAAIANLLLKHGNFIRLFKELIDFLSTEFDKLALSDAMRNTFYSLIISLFDLLVLRDIISRNFENIDNFETIIKIRLPKHNIHPDSNLAYQLRNESKSNRYIGVSLTCCIKCGHYLNFFSFDFRGCNTKIDENWENPDNNIIINLNNVDNQGFPIFIPAKETDLCEHSNKIVADDMCHYLKYYTREFNNQREFKFVIEELN